MRRGVEAACLAIVAVAQVALFTRLLHTALDFDEGTYLVALDALRSGQQLGSEVFTAQPPVFYLLLQAIADVLGTRPDDVRLGIVLVSLVGTGGAWLLARCVAGSVAGVTAAALVVVAPPVPLFAARVLSDLPSLWIGLLALGLAAVASRATTRLGTAAGVGAGALAAAAVLTKPSAAIAWIVLVVLLARPAAGRQRRLVAAACGAALVVMVVALANLGAVADIWEGVVGYHRRAGETPPVIGRWGSIADLFNVRTPALWLTAAGAVVFAARLVRRRASAAEAALWAWSIVAFAFLATYSPIHYNHLVALPVPLAVAAGTSLGAQVAALRGRRELVAVVALAVVLTGGYAQQWRRVAVAVEPQSSVELAAAATLERVTRPGELVASDLPVSAVLARREVPGPLVDVAFLRFQTGSLTPAEVLREVDAWCVSAVVAGRAFARQPELMAGLERRFAARADAEGATVFHGRRGTCVRGAGGG